MAEPQPFQSPIGRLVSGRDVELAALAMLKRWTPTYLAEAERQTGRDPKALPRMRSWTTTNEFEKWPEDQLPSVLLISPGLAEPPSPDGRGYYRAKFSLGLAVIVSANTADSTAALAKLYCAVLRACMVQHQSLEGFASGVDWMDETYDDLPSEDGRTLGAGQLIFAVEVEAIARRWNGPAFPSEPPDDDADPLPEDPTVETVEITTQPWEATQ